MSLIPLQPLGGRRNATQSASRGNCFVQCRPDYKVANRLVWFDAELPSKFFRQHAQQSSDKREKERMRETKPLYPSRAHILAAYSEIFFIGRRTNIGRLVSFYTRRQKPVFGSNFHRRFSFSCLHENGLL